MIYWACLGVFYLSALLYTLAPVDTVGCDTENNASALVTSVHRNP